MVSGFHCVLNCNYWVFYFNWAYTHKHILVLSWNRTRCKPDRVLYFPVLVEIQDLTTEHISRASGRIGGRVSLRRGLSCAIACSNQSTKRSQGPIPDPGGWGDLLWNNRQNTSPPDPPRVCLPIRRLQHRKVVKYDFILYVSHPCASTSSMNKFPFSNILLLFFVSANKVCRGITLIHRSPSRPSHLTSQL